MRDLREPSHWESEIVGKLLEEHFPGSEALNAQWRGARVQSVGPDGSFLVFPEPTSAVASTLYSVPVEALANDIDGGVISVLLHAPGGVMEEVELLREDGCPVLSRPQARDLATWRPDRW